MNFYILLTDDHICKRLEIAEGNCRIGNCKILKIIIVKNAFAAVI